MATDTKKKKFLHLERERLTRYQHQHRGLSFLKLGLPPRTDRKVNIIGVNTHIYKGQIPTYPLDQLPPEVDPKSIDEEKLYEEIRDMRFPIVPPLEPLGPVRRVGGKYTTVKRMTFAPVQLNLDDDKTETPIIGADGKIYKGRTKALPVKEMDQKLKGTNRPVRTRTVYDSSRGTVKPTVVSLYVDGKPPSERRYPVPLIELPYTDLNKLIKMMGIDSPEQKKKAPESEQHSPPEDAEEQVKDSKSTEGDSTGEFTSTESVGTTEETTTTSVTAGSSEVTDLVSEGEETDVEESEPEVSESEPEEAKNEEVSEPELSDSEPEEVKEEEVAEPELSESEPKE